MLRVIAGLEGLSYVLLVFVAMPLKYGWDTPQPVRLVGMIHGVLFLAYLGAVARAARDRRWDGLAIAHALAASVVPFGTVTLDATLRDEERSTPR
jgi:integral membrane protein